MDLNLYINEGLCIFPDGSGEKIALPHTRIPKVHLYWESVTPEAIATIPAVIEIVRRIAPWATLILAPTISSYGRPLSTTKQDAPHEWRSVFGLYVDDPLPTVVLDLSRTPDKILQTAAHEAYHAIEDAIETDMQAALWIERVDRERRHPLYPCVTLYHRRAPEQRARMFEATALRHISGMPPIEPVHFIDQFFEAIWDGSVGQELLPSVRRRTEYRSAA